MWLAGGGYPELDVLYVYRCDSLVFAKTTIIFFEVMIFLGEGDEGPR